MFSRKQIDDAPEQTKNWRPGQTSERGEAEEQILNHGRTTLGHVEQAASIGLFVWDVPSRRFTPSDSLKRLYGLDPQKLSGGQWDSMIHHDDRERVLSSIRKAFAEGRREGALEFRIARPAGEDQWVEARGHVTYGADGAPLSVLGFLIDISKHKRAEEAVQRAKDELEERVRERTTELERSNRELEDFAFVASHDLQEPLRKIQMFGEMVIADYKGCLDEKGVDYLLRMKDAAARMQGLISALLEYSRVTTKAEPFEPVDLDQAVKEAISNVDYWLRKEQGKVEAEPLPPLHSDRSQVVRLFQNLLSNGLKYRKPGQMPLVRVYARRVADPNPSFQVFFEDNGIGFEEKNLDRILKPFERLHGRGSQYSGVGMGLAICKKIVERHKGKITARSTPGKGSTFIVTFPANGAVDPHL